MKKQKQSKKAASQFKSLHGRRAAWFAVLVIGLLFIQLAYNMQSGQPKILGYTAHIEDNGLLDATNRQRDSRGLQPLQTNEKLRKAAQTKADDMANRNYWDHLTPEGTEPWYFLHQSEYAYQAAGENLAYGFATNDEIINAWLGSTTHRQNVLGRYEEVGFGVAHAHDYQGGKNTVVVALYASPISGPSALTNAATINFNTTAARVNGLAIISSGNATWATYASLGLIGAAAIGFIITHLELLRLGWYRGKHFLVVHPIFDVAVVVTLALVLVYVAGGFIR
jgi:hypothetical protein